MASITQHYGITSPVPFVDVEVTSDNLWFVDPRRIRVAQGPEPFRGEALQCLDTLFQVTRTGVLAEDPTVRNTARTNLHVFNEPWETRLGMSDSGFQGHGAAHDLGEDIWNVLTTDLEMFLDVGILQHLEHLPIYIQGIDRDITSDITTRIVYAALANFTAAMLAKHPQFTESGHATVTVNKQVWDASASEWAERQVTLPVADGKHLLLVPKSWVGRYLLMHTERFYKTTLLSYVQELEAVVGSDGKVYKTPKDTLKKRQTLARGTDTLLKITKHAHANGVDLVAVFENFVKSHKNATAA